MKYENPIFEVITFEDEDVVTLSVGSGDGGSIDGDDIYGPIV